MRKNNYVSAFLKENMGMPDANKEFTAHQLINYNLLFL